MRCFKRGKPKRDTAPVDRDSLTEQLKADEGWRASAYRDTQGYLTIGYGFLIDARLHGELPKEIGEAWLRQVAEARVDALFKKLPWLRHQPADVKLALSNMAYQLGVDGVCGFKHMLAALKAGDRPGAAFAALDSAWARQTPKRARRAAGLIRGN
jgi:lysozyme